MKYASHITAIGEMANELLEKNQSIILVDERLAKNLINTLAVQHAGSMLEEEIGVGDTWILGNLAFVVTDIGENANENFQQTGHCTLVFNTDAITMPGQIALKGDSLPVLGIGQPLEIR